MSEKKITFKDLKNAAETGVKEGLYHEIGGTTPFKWNGIELQIHNNLSLETMVMFVRDVVSSSFNKETSEFIPEATDLAVKCSILEYYAGIKIPKDVNGVYDLVYRTDIIDCILQYVNREQFCNITSAIAKKIEHIAAGNIEALNKQMNEAVANVNTLVNNTDKILGNINTEDISKLIAFIGDGSVDEYKIAKAFSENMTPALSEA